MKIVVLSDSHDNIWNLEKVIKIIKEKKCETVIFCGDLIAPFTAAILSKTDLETYLVLGNNDEDHIRMLQKGGEKFHWTGLSEEYAKLDFDGRKIAFCHYPKLGELLAKTGDYDAVFHGHTHKQYSKHKNKTLLANPGAICGIVEGKSGLASFMVYDSKENRVELIEIK